MKKIIFLLNLSLAFFATTGFSQGVSATVSDQQILNMLEEEKMAKEVYTAFYEKWQHPSFDNIRTAEQRHMELMLQLATDKGLKIPQTVTNGQVGVFQNADLQKMYDQFLAAGSKSLVEAFKVGAKIEEIDIRDLKSAIADTDDVPAIRTYTILMQCSENHLRAFTRNLERHGVTYMPVVLDSPDYKAIISGKNTCTGVCCRNISGLNGNSCKKGMGPGKNKGSKAGACFASN